jgi:hypothetical protein
LGLAGWRARELAAAIKVKGGIRVSTEYLATLIVGEYPIQLDQRFIGRHDEAGIERDRTSRVECIGGPNSARLKIELLKLNADCCSC